MRRSNEQGTWKFDVAAGLRVVGHRGGEQLVATLAIDDNADRLAFMVVRLEWAGDGTSLAGRPAPDVATIESWASTPGAALALLDQRNTDEPVAGDPLPMRLPVHGSGRKPNSFYERVLFFKDLCYEHGLPYAERLAADNGVAPGVVYRWVAEARRRGLTAEGDQ